MTPPEPIEFSLSKRKLVRTAIGALAFVGAGFFFLLHPPVAEGSFFRSSLVLMGLGLVCILFFGWVLLASLRKLTDSKPGLLIDSSGITDNAGGIPAGHIPWADVREIGVLQLSGVPLLMIRVQNPEAYVARQSNPLKRKLADLNLKKYGSPVSITANTMNCKFQDLLAALEAQYKFYKR